MYSTAISASLNVHACHIMRWACCVVTFSVMEKLATFVGSAQFCWPGEGSNCVVLKHTCCDHCANMVLHLWLVTSTLALLNFEDLYNLAVVQDHLVCDHLLCGDNYWQQNKRFIIKASPPGIFFSVIWAKEYTGEYWLYDHLIKSQGNTKMIPHCSLGTVNLHEMLQYFRPYTSAVISNPGEVILKTVEQNQTRLKWKWYSSHYGFNECNKWSL